VKFGAGDDQSRLSRRVPLAGIFLMRMRKTIPTLPAHQQYRPSPKAAWLRQPPVLALCARSDECGQNCNTESEAPWRVRGFPSSLTERLSSQPHSVNAAGWFAIRSAATILGEGKWLMQR
jgi:hypothetical protein